MSTIVDRRRSILVIDAVRHPARLAEHYGEPARWTSRSGLQQAVGTLAPDPEGGPLPVILLDDRRCLPTGGVCEIVVDRKDR